MSWRIDDKKWRPVGEAKDDKKIQEFNYRATKEALARAVKGEPKASEVTAKKDAAHHPFAAG